MVRKINENKSIHTTFTALRHSIFTDVKLNIVSIPVFNIVKYPGMNMERSYLNQNTCTKRTFS